MLTVPQEIKDILHQDTGYKNIRIHFPDGERADICNDLIVKDTVTFKESLCSQDTLKFGLCEAPVFECEVVGVENIKGATIEVFCEVECPSSVTGAEWRVDLEKYVYPIPYGLFIVDSSTRQADMIHRKITAYGGQAIKDWEICEFEQEKPSKSESYNPLLAFFLANNDFDLIKEYVDEVIQPWSAFGTEYPAAQVSFSSGSYPIGQRYYADIVITEGFYIVWDKFTSGGQVPHYTNVEKEKAFRIDANFLYNPLLEEAVDAFLSQYDILDRDKSFIKNIMRNGIIVISDKIGDSQTRSRYVTNISRKNLYPYMENFYKTGVLRGQLEYRIPYYVKVRIRDLDRSSSVVAETTFRVLHGAATLYERTIKSAYSYLESFVMSVPSTVRDPDDMGAGWYIPDYTGVNVQQLANAYAELLGNFVYIKGSNIRSINIKRQFGLTPSSSLYPGSTRYPMSATGGKLLPEDYQSCWYDDDYSMPFGAVECLYKNTVSEEVLFILYLQGYDKNSDLDSYKTYSISDNEIIKGGLWTSAQIQEICEVIASNIEGVSYMPVEFVGRGLPYVEAGDTFEILTKSNDSITTIVLNRTITGEQTLTDSYKSV